jgi:hypothetical protein
MDAFYASVELLRYPELRGRPVVIGGGRRHQPVLQPDGTRRFATLRDYTGRGVITTATYPARAFGVHSGMGLMKAAALAPDAVLLPVDFDEYRHSRGLQGRGGRGRAADRGPRHRRDLHRPHRRARARRTPSATTRTAAARAWRRLDPQQRAEAHRPDLLDRRHAEQAAAKIASELDKPDGLTVLSPRPTCPAASGRCRCAHQRHRPEGDGAKLTASASHHRRTRRARPRLAGAALRQAYGAGCTRRRTARRPAGGDAQRAGVDEPRDHLRARPARRARPRRARRIFTALCRAGGRRPAAQGLRGPHHRHQAALRRLQTVTRDLTLAAPVARRRRHPPARPACA